MESIGISVREDADWVQGDMLTVTDSHGETTNPDMSIGDHTMESEAEAEAATGTDFEEAPNGLAQRPCGGHENEGQKGKTRNDIGSPISQGSQPTPDDCCAASVACSEVLPVVFACSVEDVKAADEPVQRSLRIYRHEASIVLRQPRVLSYHRVDDQRDGGSQARQEPQEPADSNSGGDPATLEDMMNPLEALSPPEAEEQPAGDGKDTGENNKAEREHSGASTDPTPDSDSLAPVFLFLVTTAAAVTIMAAVVHPFGANLSSGIIAIAVFLSLSKWHTSLVTPGGAASRTPRHARLPRVHRCTKTVHYGRVPAAPFVAVVDASVSVSESGMRVVKRRGGRKGGKLVRSHTPCELVIETVTGGGHNKSNPVSFHTRYELVF